MLPFLKIHELAQVALGNVCCYSVDSPGINTPYVCMYCMFRSVLAILRYIDPLQSPFLLSAMPPYIGQCLRVGSALPRHVVYVMPLCYEM
jgi:hypothetical protein